MSINVLQINEEKKKIVIHVVIYKMSIFQLSLILQLFFYVYGADKNLTTFTNEFDYDNSSFNNISFGVNRIVGGKPTEIKKYPFMISIQLRRNSDHRCGATYILPRYVLTAAHCVTSNTGMFWHREKSFRFIAVAGSTSLKYTPTWQIQSIDKILVHPGYNPMTMAHDIAILRIAKPFRLTPYITYATLPTKYNPNLINTPLMCEVLGWGKTSTSNYAKYPRLQRAEVPLIPSKQCAKYQGYQNILSDHICAGFESGGIDACQGDSGGPLICNGMQVGVISWGIGCAAPRAPGVYNRVDVHLAWINETIMRSSASLMKLNYLVFTLLLVTI